MTWEWVAFAVVVAFVVLVVVAVVGQTVQKIVEAKYRAKAGIFRSDEEVSGD